jgi:penicillin-binding protein 1A
MDKYATGGHYALPIWLTYMSRALKGVPQAQFEPPNENIVWVNIDGDTGKRATAETRQPVLEAYLKGTDPPDETQQIATPNGAPAPSTTAAQEALIKGL